MTSMDCRWAVKHYSFMTSMAKEHSVCSCILIQMYTMSKKLHKKPPWIIGKQYFKSSSLKTVKKTNCTILDIGIIILTLKWAISTLFSKLSALKTVEKTNCTIYFRYRKYNFDILLKMSYFNIVFKIVCFENSRENKLYYFRYRKYNFDILLKMIYFNIVF